MPIIIWGQRNLTSTLGRGDFYCPQCDRRKHYTLEQFRPWFTLYFIPIFPCGGVQRYVRCDGCDGTFVEEVLDMAPPSEEQGLASAAAGYLEEGASLQTVEDWLRDQGVEAEQAREVVADLAGPDAWGCARCGQRYIKTVPRCRRCAG